MKKLTIEELLGQEAKKPNMCFESDVLNRKIDFERIQTSKIFNILKEVGSGTMDEYDSYLYIIYLSVPMFRNKELQTKYDLKDSPYKVVEEIFQGNIFEITRFGEKIIGIYGITKDKVDNVKK